jgi:hypothetical protein
MRTRLLLSLVGLLAASSVAATPVSLAGADGDPWPLGVCVHVPSAHAEPICVLVDPTE